MLVKAKWNVKDSAGWHRSGEVFNTKEDLGDSVEVLDAPKGRETAKAPETAPKQEPAVTESAEAAETEQPKTRNAGRRRVSK